MIAIKNKAMKGDIPAIMFIRSLTEETAEVDAEAVRQEIDKVADELRGELRASCLPDNGGAELWLLAKQLLTLRRIALTTAQTGHADITSLPQKNGPDRMELSADNRIYNDLLKQWRADWKDYKVNLIQSEMQRKMLKRNI